MRPAYSWKAVPATAAAFVFVMAGGGALADPPQYHVDWLGPASDIEDINAGGVVVGGYSDPVTGDMRAYAAGLAHPYELLPLPAGYTRNWANNINEAGVIVGGASIQGYPNEHGDGVVWTPDGQGGYDVEVLGHLPGHTGSVAIAINNRGDVIGKSVWNNSGFGPTVWFNAPGGILHLGYDVANPSEDINGNGLVVGFAATPFDIDTMQALPFPPDTFGPTTIRAANDNDEFAGYARACTSCSSFAVRYTHALGWEQIGVSPGSAYDINGQGDTVAESNAGGYTIAVVHFSGEGTFEIRDLLAPEFGNWLFCGSCSSVAINDARQIAIIGHNAGEGLEGLVVLTPMEDSPADVNGDGLVDAADLALLLGTWGPCPSCPADLNGDSLVDAADLGQLLGHWSIP